jgi:hypothetical protein
MSASSDPRHYAPDGSGVTVAREHWDDLRKKDVPLLCNRTQFEPGPEGGLLFRFLNEDVLVAPGEQCLKRYDSGAWVRTEDPLLELATVLHLVGVRDVYPLGRDLVGQKDLKEGHFFQGPHALRIEKVLERYGRDAAGFGKAAERLGGEPVDMADSAWRLKPFPRIHLYYLLWEGDNEFPPRLNLLFDRSIENSLAADAIWGLVTRVSTALLKAGT